MPKNDTNFEKEVKNILIRNGKMRREGLIRALTEAHIQTTKKGHTNVRNGYSKPTINRTLKKMVASGQIIRLDYNQLQQYGFNEEDKRATYYFTPEGLKLKAHIDDMLRLLKTGDDNDKQMALKELNRHEEIYSFDESQLDLLVENLTSLNAELVKKFLVTLRIYIIDKGKEPKNIDTLLLSLRTLLDTYSDPKGYHGNIRSTALCLLCHYKNEYIIDQIIKDATTLINPLEVEEEYDETSIADLVVNNPSRLFNAERQLTREGKHTSVDFISNIRYKCMDYLGLKDHTKKEEVKRRFNEAEEKLRRGGPI